MTTNTVSAKRPEGVTLIAIVHFIFGGLGLLGLIMLFIMGAFFASVSSWAVLPAMALIVLGCTIVGVLSVIAIAAGIGLLQMRSWARWVTIILAILNLAAFPIGTVIGGLMIWYLLQENIAAQFENRVVVEPAQPAQPTQPIKPAQVVESPAPQQPQPPADDNPPDVTAPPAE